MIRARSHPMSTTSRCPSWLLLFSALAASGALACPEGGTPPGGEGSAAASSSAAPPSSGGAPPGVVGEADCDAYVTNMRACIAKLPEADRAPKEKVLEASLATWRDQAARPETRANLKTTCKAALDALASNPLCR